jgi:hypothetical protein
LLRRRRGEEEKEDDDDDDDDGTTFLDVLKGLEAGRKYMCQFYTVDNIIMCSQVENELYRLITP